MGSEKRMIGKSKCALVVLLLAFFGLYCGQAKADSLTLEGSTTGSFSGIGDFGSGGLTFSGTSFDTTTSGNTTLDLGSFSLGDTSSLYLGQFTLDVTFSLPAGLTSGNSNSFTALLLGDVLWSSGAALVVDFSPSSEIFSFSNPTDSGSFTLSIPSVAMLAGNTVSLDGYVTGATDTPLATPEPSTLLLLASGLALLFFFKRRAFAF